MDISELNKKAKEIVENLNPKFKDIRMIRDRIKTHPYVLDREFYLKMQSELSEYFDYVVTAYLKLKSLLKWSIANFSVVLRKEYKDNDEKIPSATTIENEIIAELKDLYLAESILKAKEQIVRNLIQTCRSHVSAITGRSSGEEKEEN